MTNYITAEPVSDTHAVVSMVVPSTAIPVKWVEFDKEQLEKVIARLVEVHSQLKEKTLQ